MHTYYALLWYGYLYSIATCGTNKTLGLFTRKKTAGNAKRRKFISLSSRNTKTCRICFRKAFLQKVVLFNKNNLLKFVSLMDESHSAGSLYFSAPTGRIGYKTLALDNEFIMKNEASRSLHVQVCLH